MKKILLINPTYRTRGLHVLMMPDEAAAYGDAIVIGEGEGSCRACSTVLIAAAPLRSRAAPGLLAPRREFLRKNFVQTVQTSRGCHNCKFKSRQLPLDQFPDPPQIRPLHCAGGQLKTTRVNRQATCP